MAIDLILMGATTDLSGGDVDIVITAGETQVSGNGAPGTGTQWYPKANGAILGAASCGETAAATDIRFRKTTDAKWNHLLYLHLQTAAMPYNMISPCNYPITTGDAIQAQGTGTNTLKTVGFYVAKKPTDKVPTQTQPDNLPPGTMMVEATSTFTHVADTIATGTIVFSDWTPTRDQVYGIVGMAADSASGHFTRLQFLEGPNKDDVPGVPTTDTAVALDRAFWGDFGEFKGQTPPNCSTVAEAADAVTNLRLWIYPKGASR